MPGTLRVLFVRGVFLCLLCSSIVEAAEVVSYERVLIPIVISHEVPGAFGSRWTTHTTFLNNSGQAVDIKGYVAFPHGCLILCGPQPPTPSGVTFFPAIGVPGTSTQGAIILVDRRYADSVEIRLRVQDVSRQDQTWGTEIPVVREKGLYQGTLSLLDVPLGLAFRQSLRIYDVDARQDARIRVRFYRANAAVDTPFNPFDTPPSPDVLLAERTLPLVAEQRSETPTYDLGYAEIANLSALPELQSADRIRIEVTSLTTGLRFWAFVSVTNNETQHITIVSPH